MKTAIRIVIALASACSSGVWACGICVDDKVAATYDYAIIQRAAAKGDFVVFCEIEGLVDARRLAAGARKIPGIDPATVRVSVQPAGISFAIDRKRQSPSNVMMALEQQVPGLHLSLLKVIDAMPDS